MIRTEHQPQPNGIAARAIAVRDGIAVASVNSLPAMIDRAVKQLASATSAAEVLDARDIASVAYDAAKKAARLARAKGAHDELIAKAHRSQADALEIEAAAKRRLADEYDAAQERGEVAKQGNIPEQNVSTLADIGLTAKDIHEAREIRDAEDADPGIVRRTLDADLSANQEPTKASVRKAIKAIKEGTMEGEPQVAAPVKGHGPRINIPEGITAEAHCRTGMAMEASGLAGDEAASKLGIGRHAYRQMRDIVLLADRGGFSEADTATVARALSLLNETQRVGDPWVMIEAIAAKVWGAGQDSSPRAVREEKRIEQFEHRFGIIMQSCMTGAELDLPYLSVDRAKKAGREINAARRHLSDLLNRIKGVHE